MKDLIIKGESGTFFTPHVKFEATTGNCSIMGESYLEDAFEFYDSLIEWVEKFFESGSQKIAFDFKLTYFNTSSARAILDLLRSLKEFKEKGGEVTVNWHYPNPDDDDLLQEAHDFMDESELEMNLVEYEVEEEE